LIIYERVDILGGSDTLLLGSFWHYLDHCPPLLRLQSSFVYPSIITRIYLQSGARWHAAPPLLGGL
jgi:hypothetical protein